MYPTLTYITFLSKMFKILSNAVKNTLGLSNSHQPLVQILPLFDKDMRVEKTLMQPLACQLLSNLM